MKCRTEYKLKSWLLGVVGAVSIALSGVMGPALLGSGAVHAADTDWKMHIVWVEARPEAQSYQRFVDLVNERAGDKLSIRLFTGGSLGVKDVDLLRILPKGGAIQAAGLYPGYMTRDEPEYAYTLPPGVVAEPQTLVDILPTLTEIYQGTYDDWGIKLLGYVQHPVQRTHVFCKEPIRTLADLEGKKVRVWEKFHVDLFEELGIAAQVVGQNDLYVALQTGVVDCAVYPVGFAKSVSIQEVAPYAAYLFPYVLHPLNILVASEAYNSLPKDVQSILDETAKQIEKETNEAYLAGTYDDEAAEELEELGATILEPFPSADRERFSQTARRLWQEVIREEGGAAEENFHRVTEAIDG